MFPPEAEHHARYNRSDTVKLTDKLVARQSNLHSKTALIQTNLHYYKSIDSKLLGEAMQTLGSRLSA